MYGIVYCEIVPIAEFSIILTLIAENSSSTLRDLTKSPFLNKKFLWSTIKSSIKICRTIQPVTFLNFLVYNPLSTL